MPQVQTKVGPGYGVVYPDGVSGLKVVRTFTQGPSKIINPDGSASYTSSPPTIHELYGGGFSYAGGGLVTNRKHLEGMPPGDMKEKALEWFDSNAIKERLASIPQDDIPPLNLEDKKKPEPAWVLSSTLPPMDEVRESKNQPAPEVPINGDSALDKLAQSIASLVEAVKTQGEKIAMLEGGSPGKKKKPIFLVNTKQSEIMKARWAAKRLKEVENGNNVTKTSENL